MCSSLVEKLDSLYSNLQAEGINDVNIIAIGKSQYSNDNSNWTSFNSIHVVIDPSPNCTWTSWGASQRDLFFLDREGNYHTHYNISEWNYNQIYNTILEISEN